MSAHERAGITDWPHDLAAALETGFRSDGWPGALRKGIEVNLTQRKNNSGYVSPYFIAGLYADLGEKEHAFEWLNTAYQERDSGLPGISYRLPNGFA